MATAASAATASAARASDLVGRDIPLLLGGKDSGWELHLAQFPPGGEPLADLRVRGRFQVVRGNGRGVVDDVGLTVKRRRRHGLHPGAGRRGDAAGGKG